MFQKHFHVQVILDYDTLDKIFDFFFWYSTRLKSPERKDYKGTKQGGNTPPNIFTQQRLDKNWSRRETLKVHLHIKSHIG